MKKLFSLAFAAIVSLSIAGSALAQTQSIGSQGILDSQVKFGAISVDLTHARMIDVTNGAQKVVDANGVTRTGYFWSTSVVANHPAFKGYIRSYNGSQILWNAAMFTVAECVNGVTRLTWINGGTTEIQDSCSIVNAVNQHARAN